MRNGRFASGFNWRRRITAPIWPINCTRIRRVTRASMTACKLRKLQAVIDALVTLRILVQFIGQIGAVMRLRQLKPDANRPFRMWLYPLPALVALLGWIFLFVTSGAQP